MIEHLYRELEDYYEETVMLPKYLKIHELTDQLRKLEGTHIDLEQQLSYNEERDRLIQEIESDTGEKWTGADPQVIIKESNRHQLIPKIQENHIFGPCYRCQDSKPPLRLSYARLKSREIRKHLNICIIPRQCANADGELFEPKKEMFVCEDCTDGTYKKCPHCGIKTLKPDGCNYVMCGDHRWCFICEERLEVTHGGHNEHYYTGPGTSPYTNRCRQSMNLNDKPRFILNTCNCYDCRQSNGLPLCRTLDCMNRTFYVNHGTRFKKERPAYEVERKPNAYCKTCQESILVDGKETQASMINCYGRYNDEPNLAMIYYI